MQLTIKGKNLKVSDDRRALITRKFERLDHYLDRILDATIELTAETANRQADERLSVEVTLHLPNGVILRAEEHHSQLPAAIDQVYDKIQRQITRYKERSHDHKGRGRNKITELDNVPSIASPRIPADADVALDEDTPRIVRVKNFVLEPMSPEVAVDQMELLGHNFYLFADDDSGRTSIVYRRDDGAYGLIQPTG